MDSRVGASQSLSSYRGIRTLVLGASGFIGRWVARKLSQQGAELILVVRTRASAEPVLSSYKVHGTLFDLDLCDFGLLHDFLRDVRPAIAFNLAGYGVDSGERDEGLALLTNSGLVEVLCEALWETRDQSWAWQNLVHVGSALEYGAIGGNLHEDSMPNPTTMYGKSKLAGTMKMAEFCQSTGLRGLTARLFTVYGPGEHKGRLLPSLTECARGGSSLQLTSGTQKRDFTYVEDVADGLLRLGLADASPGGVVNLATGNLKPVREFVETAASVLGIPMERLKFGALPTRVEEMNHLPVSVVRLLGLAGWVPQVGLSEGIRRTWEFEMDGGTGA